MQDKRRHKRYKVATRGIEGKMMLAKDVELIDISMSGISLKTDKKLNPGSSHILNLKYEDKVISLKSMVAWSFLSALRKNSEGDTIPLYTAGMEFTDVSKNTINELKTFIEKHKIEEYKVPDISISSERRLYVRFHTVTLEQATLHSYESYRVKQLSLSGMLIESEQAHEIEDRLQMEIFLLEDEPINVLGRVASCLSIKDTDQKYYDIGIEFLEMSKQDEEILKAFVNSLHGGNKGLLSLQNFTGGNKQDKRQDKRQDRRFIKRCETEFIVDGITHRGISSNLSSNGLFISTNRPFPSDTMLEIVIHLPNGLTSKLKGRVRRAIRKFTEKAMVPTFKLSKNGMGIEIIEKDDNYLEFIKSLPT